MERSSRIPGWLLFRRDEEPTRRETSLGKGGAKASSKSRGTGDPKLKGLPGGYNEAGWAYRSGTVEAC
ncbi:hypothetical protein E2C01_059830 [Portunus trituberculatus]|uniref:Uncharacterized protein n=1 Tax=Portunus trituberculatus TaxID=210409 RepID=A0A5B7HAD4_PORTR|nr:hypothetical protein [Portunus trituberculatus]